MGDRGVDEFAVTDAWFKKCVDTLITPFEVPADISQHVDEADAPATAELAKGLKKSNILSFLADSMF
jgi:hypothetical protein